MAGQESPYELMLQEVDRIFAALLERAKQRVSVEKLRNYQHPAEKSIRKEKRWYGEIAHNSLNDDCPNCHQSSALVETRFKMKNGSLYSGVNCFRCGWASALKELCSNGEVYKRPFDDQGLL
jgi:hypothetical protein